MSRKRRSDYVGCSVDSRNGLLRLRFRWDSKQQSFGTRLADTPEHRLALTQLARLVAANIKAGRDPRPTLTESLRSGESEAPQATVVVPLTVQGYFERWVADKVPPEVRRAQANDYRRHMKGYVLPLLGDMPLAVTARDILGLRTELRQRGLSLKYVKNVLAGSFKAMLRDARLIDRVLAAEPFEGVTWPRVEVPEADPFAPDERQRIPRGSETGDSASAPDRRRRDFASGRTRRTIPTCTRSSGPGCDRPRRAGLRWSNVGSRPHEAHNRPLPPPLRGQRPEDQGAQRSVDLLPETVNVLRSIEPIRVSTETFVFVNTLGRPLEPRAFLPHWYACLRSRGSRSNLGWPRRSSGTTAAGSRLPRQTRPERRSTSSPAPRGICARRAQFTGRLPRAARAKTLRPIAR